LYVPEPSVCEKIESPSEPALLLKKGPFSDNALMFSQTLVLRITGFEKALASICCIAFSQFVLDCSFVGIQRDDEF
jgi:hypothetical protein